MGLKACLWSRVANRVLLPICLGQVNDDKELYTLAQTIDWDTHLDPTQTLAVDFLSAGSAIKHTQYGALKVKDAVVDQFRDRYGYRPNVERSTPDIRINVYVSGVQARIAIDLSGSSLHRRGYRFSGGLAPLKENLAAAVLMASGWSECFESGQPLSDPLCGSGTLLIEAAMMACNQAPGLLRDYFGFLGWKLLDQSLWNELLADARSAIVKCPVPIVGSDNDAHIVEQCRKNLENAGFSETIEVYSSDASGGRSNTLKTFDQGLVVTNPPYGERMPADQSFYQSLGLTLSRAYAGWRCGLFTAQSSPYQQSGLPLHPTLSTRNGGIDCVLLLGDIPASAALRNVDTVESSSAAPLVDAEPFINRLNKNQRKLNKWLKREEVAAYRLYDADIPEFSVAVDVYEADSKHCVVQEYQAPKSVNVAMAQARLAAVLACLPEAVGVAEDQVHLKLRGVQSGHRQYDKLDSDATVRATVTEYGAKYELNFTDYLDVGLFLDHRPLRKFISQNAGGKRFLNLFSYTGSATVSAVIGGSAGSVSVDSSKTYCEWARRNLSANGASATDHIIERQDVLSWLNHARSSLSQGKRFDLILLDPPTFSNSTSMDRDWNVQRDYIETIDACLELMEPGGLLIFSTNFRQFKLDKKTLESRRENLQIEDRTRWSIDEDYQRNSRIHQCWFIHG